MQGVWEERVFVRRLVAAHEGLEAFLLANHPIEQAVIAVGDLDGAGLVDGGVARELDALDQGESDGVFEAADAIVSESVIWISGGSSVHELEADVGQIEGLAGVGEIDCCIHCGLCVCCDKDKEN